MSATTDHAAHSRHTDLAIIRPIWSSQPVGRPRSTYCGHMCDVCYKEALIVDLLANHARTRSSFATFWIQARVVSANVHAVRILFEQSILNCYRLIHILNVTISFIIGLSLSLVVSIYMCSFGHEHRPN